ncbi:MAG: hypothetical protein DRO88_05075 [Promethearchaeia archaeon]|nr:MAG: hypothetical protein DRO88_05075 [Candidatus Lokiarchaeia archaeon]
MPTYNADLHLHSPYSIAVSQKISLDTLNNTASMKGIDVLGTGDITQPNWLSYMRKNLEKRENSLYFKDTAFILQTELEDAESIHQLVLLPDFSAVDALVERISPYVKNITGRWAGRPHVHRSPGELVEIVEEVNGLIGPAHAFTPFKSIFRQGKFGSLRSAYGTSVKKLAFLELGLSADTYLADRMEELQNITFISNSDAHSEGVDSVGREFNRFQIEALNFEEIKKALLRKEGRKIILNVGLDPRLGKYYKMFCTKCRRRTIRSIVKDSSHMQNSVKNLFGFPVKKWDDDFLYYEFPTTQKEQKFLQLVAKKRVECPACRKNIQLNRDPKKQNAKVPTLQLGVSERINELGTWERAHHPVHRPPYLHIIPLIELLAKILGIKSLRSKRVQIAYQNLLKDNGKECFILVDKDLTQMAEKYRKVAEVIQAFRDNNIAITPGGGGKFGELEL